MSHSPNIVLPCYSNSLSLTSGIPDLVVDLGHFSNPVSAQGMTPSHTELYKALIHLTHLSALQVCWHKFIVFVFGCQVPLFLGSQWCVVCFLWTLDRPWLVLDIVRSLFVDLSLCPLFVKCLISDWFVCCQLTALIFSMSSVVVFLHLLPAFYVAFTWWYDLRVEHFGNDSDLCTQSPAHQ